MALPKGKISKARGRSRRANWKLTLPGIAGIVLTIGMAVDANVIIFARIREEIGAGKSVKGSIKTGFQKALSAILDGNITTLIAAIILSLKGSGSVKGFAHTLALSIVVSMFTALVITRLVMNAFYALFSATVQKFCELLLVVHIIYP